MFSHRHLHIHILLPRDGFTRKYHHVHGFIEGCFYTKEKYTRTRGHFYAQMPLHSVAFTEECFYTRVRLHRVSVDTVSFYTQKILLHGIKYSYAEMFFTQKNICTKASF